MTTGTNKDPFEDYKRPICGEFVEIGQPTFAEIIWAREVLSKATSGANPDVATALRLIAYSKGPITLPEARTPKSFSAIPPPVAAQVAAAKYAVNARDNAKAFKQKVKGLGMAKASVEFRKLIVNDFEADIRSLQPLADNCAMISGNNAPAIMPSGCPASDCNIDAVFSIDTSNSTALDYIQTSVVQLADLISTVSSGSYRLALSTYNQSVGDLLPLLDLTHRNCANRTEYQNNVGILSTSYAPARWHQQLAAVAQNQDTKWTFRDDADAKVVFVITDSGGPEGHPSVLTDEAVTAATEMGRCGIRLVIVWTGPNPYLITGYDRPGYANEGEFFTDLANRTDGIFMWVPNGQFINSYLTSFVFSLCAATVNTGCDNMVLNGKFDTSIANWTDLSTLPGRTASWDSGSQSLKLNGAAGQTVADLVPGDTAILSFDAWVETSPSVVPFHGPDVHPECPLGYTLIDNDDWAGQYPVTISDFQGWSGNGLGIRASTVTMDSAITLTAVNNGTGTGSLTDKLFLTALTKIKTCNIDGSNLVDLLTGSGNARDIDIDLVRNHIYWTEINQFTGTENAIYRANIDGTNIVKIKDIVMSIGLVVDDIAPGYIYYGEYGAAGYRIIRLDLDGTNPVTIATSTRPILGMYFARDPDGGGYIYFAASSNFTNGGVYRVTIDRGFVDPPNLTTIVDETTQSTITNIRGIAVDPNNNKIYASTASNLIWMDLDGSNYEVIGAAGGAGDDLWIDFAAGRIYLADGGLDTVYSYNLDGSNRQQLFPNDTANFSGVTRGNDNAGYMCKTTTGLTPGDTFSFTVVWSYWAGMSGGGTGSVVLQLFDGDILLTERVATGTPDLEDSITATVPTNGQVTVCIRVIPDPSLSLTIGIDSTSICVSSDAPPAVGLLEYKLRDSITTVLTEGSVTDSDLQPPGVENAQRFDLYTTVGADGVLEVFFTAENGDDVDFYIDNVLLCILKADDCGPGTRNLVANPNFDTGVENWTDRDNVALSPTNDPELWDEQINAIIVDIAKLGVRPEVRTTLTGLTPNSNYSLNFELTSFEPYSIDVIQLEFGVLASDNTIIARDFRLRSEVDPPERLQVDFVAPSDGIVRIYFKGGLTSGVAKIRNVLCCDSSGECETGYTRLSFDDFSTGRGGWAGGSYDATNHWITLGAASGSGDNTISQTFSSLTPGAVIQLSFNVLNTESVAIVGTFLVEFHSGGVIDQFNTGGSAGIKTFSSVVQDTGTVTIIIKNITSSNASLDNILVCVQDTPACDGSITNLEVMVEWDGIPRKPTNLFNAIVRYTIRDPNDPFSISTVTHITTDEGGLGLTTCDTWKQQGQGGNPQSNILSFGMTPTLAASINTGDFASVAARTNWIWSIPDIGSIQDILSIGFPDPPAGLIESVEVFLLMNDVVPSGSDSSPVNPPPLSCSPDPATELTVTIRYINSQNLQREFTQRIARSDVWQQTADFTAGLPWDTDSAVGNGLKGSTARWESFEFVLDNVDGSGLDQCTIAKFFVATGSGVITFPEFGFQNSTGRFLDSCLAEVLITNISDGSATNEIQSIVLPSPSGGTWTLSFDFGTVETTAAIPWNASATQVRNRLAALPNINSTGNVAVTGMGTQSDPFIVTFIGTLGATDHTLLVADGTLLTGSSTAFVTTITNGTTNERQTISRNSSSVTANLTVTFGGQTTVPMAYNRSLNEAQSAIEGLSSIGAGNVAITGEITDRDAAYAGPLIVDFINDLGNQNVALMTVSPASLYTVTQDWMGGSPPAGGTNEKQEVTVEATGGTFVLRIFDVGGTSPFIEVDTVQDGGSTNVDVYDIEFGGSLANRNIEACEGHFTCSDGSYTTTVTTIVDGSGGIPTKPSQPYQITSVPLGTDTIPWSITNSSGQFNDLYAADNFRSGNILRDGEVSDYILASNFQPTSGPGFPDWPPDPGVEIQYFTVVISRIAIMSSEAFGGLAPDIREFRISLWRNGVLDEEFEIQPSVSSNGSLSTTNGAWSTDRSLATYNIYPSNTWTGADLSASGFGVGISIRGEGGTIFLGNDSNSVDIDWLTVAAQLPEETYGTSEIQRYSLTWHSGTQGPWEISDTADCNIDPIFDSIAGTLLVTFTKGVDQSAVIKAKMEESVDIDTDDLTVTAVQLAGSTNEVQTVTITGSPTGGTFTLAIAGETTSDIPYNATALQVANALNALVSLSGVTVTKTGDLPDDVVYTITFAGASGGQDWEQLVPDWSNLIGGDKYADTSDIAYNASADDVKTALTNAASWLTTSDLNVTSVSGVPDGTYQWIVEWTGAYNRTDIPQMLADGSQLTGAPIVVTEVTPGSGSNERQRLRILRATSGSFTLTVTINGESDTTSPIPWNTSAAGLKAQLLQLQFFNSPGQISVVDEYPTSLPPPPVNSSYIVVFQKIFGDVSIMVADYQDTLFCNPLILPVVDPGPYPYPLKDCDDLSDLSCQSGPLLCRPGEGDEPIPEEICCDNETIKAAANYSRRLQIERELFDPNRKIDGRQLTLRDLALVKGLDISEYTPYERNWNLGTLKETSWSTEIKTKRSFVLVENNLDTVNGRQRILSHLAGHREILPARFVWPEVTF